MNFSVSYCLLIIFSLFAFHGFSQKKLVYQDFNYEANIKTVVLAPATENPEDPNRSLRPAVINLQAPTPLILEFDDLNARYEEFHVRILHCNADWKPSVLSEIEYLPQYNDFIINDFQVSQNTKVNYYHYRFEMPTTRLSGNYLLVVHRNNNKNDFILSKRFLVIDKKVGVFAQANYAQDPALRATHQQIDLEIAYGAYRLLSPRDELKVQVRQNFRDDKMLKTLRAFSVQEIGSKLNYRFFDNENTLPAGNEYRYFDARTTYGRGVFISRIQQGKEDDLWVSVQHSRALLGYSELNDFNGQFIIENQETQNTSTAADYVYVTFGLKSKDLGAKVYVNGKFNNWALNQDNQMEYDTQMGGYVGTLRLKQGIYNYNFVVQQENQSPDEFFFEGSFSETENAYEVIVYHRPPASRADLIVGYQLVSFDKKR